MKLNFGKPRGILSEKDIADFEKSIGAKLPQSYCDWLLKYNGANIVNAPDDDHTPSVKMEWDGCPAGESGNFSYLHEFCGLNLKEYYADIKSNLEYITEARIPPDFIKIAWDPGNNYFLLGIKNKVKGQVFFQDRSYYEPLDELYEADTYPVCQCGAYRNIAFIAPSFEEFLNNIFPGPDTPQEFKQWEIDNPKKILSWEEWDSIHGFNGKTCTLVS